MVMSLRNFIYDGMGMKLLQKSGIKVGILTSEDRFLNRRR